MNRRNVARVTLNFRLHLRPLTPEVHREIFFNGRSASAGESDNHRAKASPADLVLSGSAIRLPRFIPSTYSLTQPHSARTISAGEHHIRFVIGLHVTKR